MILLCNHTLDLMTSAKNLTSGVDMVEGVNTSEQCNRWITINTYEVPVRK